MLVLSRRVGQQIRIGKSVVVTLLKVERNRARIGVQAPFGIPVFRQELLDFDKSRRTVPPENHRPTSATLRRDGSVQRTDLQQATRPRFLWDKCDRLA